MLRQENQDLGKQIEESNLGSKKGVEDLEKLRREIEEKDRQIDELSQNLDGMTSRLNASETNIPNSTWRHEKELELIEEKQER